MNLILLDDRDGIESNVVTLSDARAAHLLTVLKVAPGREVRVGLLDGPLGVGTVESAADGRVTLRCAFEEASPPRPRVDLLLALPRPKVMRRLWAQLAALGVGQIILTNAGRVERHYFDTHVVAETCYRPLLIEGLQQAGDTRLPAVSIFRQFKVMVEDHLDRLFSDGARLVADPAGRAPVPDLPGSGLQSDKSRCQVEDSAIWHPFAAQRRPDPGSRVLVAIGPEGGWSAYELALLQAHGFHAVSLGPRTLRVDTACTALLAVVHASLVQI